MFENSLRVVFVSNGTNELAVTRRGFRQSFLTSLALNYWAMYWKTTREHLQSYWRHVLRIPIGIPLAQWFWPMSTGQHRRDQRCPGCSDDTWRGPSCRNGLLCSLWICIFGCRWPMFGCQFVPDLRCWYYPSAAQSVFNWNVQEQKWGRPTWFWSKMPKTVHIQPVSCQAMLPTFWSWGSACRWSLETVLVRMESGKFCVYLAGYCVSFLLYTMLLYVSIPACDELQVNMDSNYQRALECWLCWVLNCCAGCFLPISAVFANRNGCGLRIMSVP